MGHRAAGEEVKMQEINFSRWMDNINLGVARKMRHMYDDCRGFFFIEERGRFLSLVPSHFHHLHRDDHHYCWGLRKNRGSASIRRENTCRRSGRSKRKPRSSWYGECAMFGLCRSKTLGSLCLVGLVFITP